MRGSMSGKRVESDPIDVSLWRERDTQGARGMATREKRRINEPSVYTLLVICSIQATLWLCLTVELPGGTGGRYE